MATNLILYHSKCPDGFCAAWAAWKHFADYAEYIPVVHGENPPNVTNKVVYLLDFCYPRKIMNDLVKKAKKVIVIDHHVGMMQEMKDFKEAELNFDLTHSGCVLSWKYFHPNQEIPELLNIIEARDLYKPNWESHLNFLTAFDSMAFRKFSDLDSLAPVSIKGFCDIYLEFADMGMHMEKFRKMMIKDHVEKAIKGKIKEYDVFIVNCTSKELASQIGHELALKTDVGVAWWYDHNNNKAVVSFRSVGDIDVCKIAQFFGGGGHKNASGCSVSLETIIEWSKNEKETK